MRLRPRVRVDVLSGFLGSGKTTLLRAFLGAVPSDSIAIVINEFGSIPIDHRLIRRSDDTLHVLANGCACCAVAAQLRSTLHGLLQEDAARKGSLLTRILIETSGLADPASILRTLRADENLAEYLQPGLCVVTFDLLDGIECAEAYPEVRRQVAAADAVVLTKADLAPPGAIRRAQAYVVKANPLAACHVAGAPSFAVAELFNDNTKARAVHEPVGREVGMEADEPQHALGVCSFSLRLEGAVDWASFSVWLTSLLNRHGNHVLRFKGILESPQYAEPLVIHGVRHLVYPPQHPPGVSKRGHSDLVFIVDGLDRHRVEQSLRAFLEFARHAAIPAVQQGKAAERASDSETRTRIA